MCDLPKRMKYFLSQKNIWFILLPLIVLGGFFFYPTMYGVYAYFFGSPSMNGPKISVTYQTMRVEKIHPWSEFSGKCRAIDYVEIRPRVSGMIQEIFFKEGSIVKKNDPLFRIDPRPFEAAVAKAKANLESVISQEKLASIELKRTEKLLKTNAVSKKDFDERKSTKEVKGADIEVAKASLKTALLDLDYAHITSPINGKISRAEMTVGNIVESGANAPLLTTIVSTSPIYVDFDMDEQSYIEASKSLDTKEKNTHDIPVDVTLDGNDKTVYKGYIQYFDNQINPSTGTLKVRAVVDNPEGILVSGIFVNVNVGTRIPMEGIVVPDEAVGTDQNKKFVYILNDQKKIEYREVILKRSVLNGHLIQSGLKGGEKVIVKGIQRVRPGIEVDAKEITDKPLKISKKDSKKGSENTPPKADKKKHQKSGSF